MKAVSSVTVKSLEYNWAKVFCISRCILNQQIHPAWDWIIGQSYSGGDGGDNSLGSRFPYCYTPCRPHAAIARLGLWEVASIRDNLTRKVQLTPRNNPVPVFWIGLSSIKCKSQRSHRVKDTSAYSPELLTIDDIFRIWFSLKILSDSITQDLAGASVKFDVGSDKISSKWDFRISKKSEIVKRHLGSESKHGVYIVQCRCMKS